MIKRCAVPTLGSVAVGAIGGGERRSRSGVDGRGGLLPLGEVATGIAAIGWSNLQGEIVIDVAQSALNVGMAVGQQEASGAVIKFAVSPSGNGVTSGASGGRGGEARADVIGNITADGLRLVPIGSVAGHAVCGTQGVVVVDVAGGARGWIRRHVRADKRETGDSVIEGSGVPTFGGVAVGAICGRETRAGRGVDRIGGLLPPGQVATGVAAIRGRDL